MNKTWVAGLGLAVLVVGGCSPSKQDVATVNGREITKDELTARLIQTPAAKQELQKLILENLILDAAAKKKLSVSDQEVNQFLQYRREQLPPGRFEEVNAANGLTDAMAREDARAELALRALSMEGVKVSDADIQKRYKENPDNAFIKPEWKQIGLIVTKDQADAEKAMKSLQEGADFKTVADKFTVPAAKAQLMEFQWFGIVKDSVINEQHQPLNAAQTVLGSKPVVQAIRTTAAGKVSQPIALPALPNGPKAPPERLLVYVKSDTPGGKVPLDEVRPLIAWSIARENNETKTDVLQNIVKDAKIDVKLQQFQDLEKPDVLLPSQPAGMIAPPAAG